ncbi:guanosine monophosphate reductase [candidate division WWE3 bacterium]|nr:guanosine monophosphate reductase [candidate division WWE3 bacterium]
MPKIKKPKKTNQNASHRNNKHREGSSNQSKQQNHYPPRTAQFPLALSFDDVLLKPQYSKIKSRSEINLETQLSPYLKLEIPLMTTNMDTVTGVEMAVKISELGGLGLLPRFCAPEKQADQVAEVIKKKQIAAASVGIKKGFLERAEMLVNAGATIINVDVAHGHLEGAIEATRKIRNKFGKRITIISGITATAEAAEAHYEAGADCISVGVGSGSICTTRIMTGCGIPEFSSLMDVARAAKKHNKTFISIAGVNNSGDVVKTLATGAAAVCAGYMFAGTDEAPPEIVEIKGKKYKEYSGSTAKKEKVKQVGKYGANKGANYTKHVEGVEGLVEYRGAVADVVEEVLAGVKSGISYCGAENITELQERAEFIRVTAGGFRESGAHDVFVMG